MVRVLAIEGHAGLLDPFEHWRAGRDVPTTTGVAFSHQLFDGLRAVGATATVLAQHLEHGAASAHGITVEHTGRVLFGRSGLDYHRESLRIAGSLIARASRERFDVVMTVGYPSAGLLLPLLYAGRSVVVTHHCMLWPKFGAPTRAQRALIPLERRAYQHPRCHVLAVSDDVVSQVEALRDGKGPSIVRFLPLYRRSVFDGIEPIERHAARLRVGFIGRIERLGLADVVTCHGWCNREQLRKAMNRLHVVVAPTRSDFVEGFNMVVVEALLAQRPVITSRTCPAVEYVRGPATVETGVDDVADLARALRRFAIDRDALAQAAARSAASADFLFDERYSYRAAVREVLQAIVDGRAPRRIAPSATELRTRSEPVVVAPRQRRALESNDA